MIDYNDIPDEVLTAYVARHELPEEEASYEQAAAAGPRQLFHEWLCYEGILGYTDKILSVLDALRHAGKQPVKMLAVSKQTVLDWLGELPLDQGTYALFTRANAKRMQTLDWPLMVESLDTL